MKRLLAYFLSIVVFWLNVQPIYAAENPLAVPNNKVGIHILFDSELPEAAKFVNTSGGDWGYVTIPIQIGDRDLVKWQTFMDRAKQYHVIPLIRLASEGDYFNKAVWAKPRPEDIVDFANFLDSLDWPTKNRYVIVFNETNRGDEWGGEVNPEEYAQLLNFAVSVFKSKNQDYFIISAGMDNAAPDQYPAYMNQYTYLRLMQDAVPGIFSQIDGFASHSYPNPGFAQPPGIRTGKSISSFDYERSLIRSYRVSDIPVFITETGWNAPNISDSLKATYYKTAFETVWADPGIVAITPFLFKAGDGPFKGFSFMDVSGGQTEQYKVLENLPKVAGKPLVAPYVLGLEKIMQKAYPVRSFPAESSYEHYSLSQSTQAAFKWILKL